MKRIRPGRRLARVAAALGAILLTAGCAGTPDPMFANRPANLDGGVGQLLRYCSKFQNSGDLVTAAAMCDRAHMLEPGNPVPLMQLADILVAMKKPAQAISVYRVMIDTIPEATEARYALGKLYIDLGQYDLAAAEFQAALYRTPDDPRIYNALGVAHDLVGAHESALMSFEDGLKVDPSHISLRNNLGLSLVLAGRYDEGIKVLDEVAADPDANATNYQNLQFAYGMIRAARADQAIVEAELGSNDAALDPGVSGTLQTAPAGQHREPAPQGQPIEIPIVQRDAETEIENAAPGAPVRLILAAEHEKAYGGVAETETPIEVTFKGINLARVQNAVEAPPARRERVAARGTETGVPNSAPRPTTARRQRAAVTEEPSGAQPWNLNGAELVEMERLLVRLALEPSSSDGIVDRQTKRAIRLYQQMAGLPVDGEPSRALLTDMREVVKILDSGT